MSGVDGSVVDADEPSEHVEVPAAECVVVGVVAGLG
jgi:hypothetical protein